MREEASTSVQCSSEAQEAGRRAGRRFDIQGIKASQSGSQGLPSICSNGSSHDGINLRGAAPDGGDSTSTSTGLVIRRLVNNRRLVNRALVNPGRLVNRALVNPGRLVNRALVNPGRLVNRALVTPG